MSNTLKKSIFFAGGKVLFPETNELIPGLRFEKLDDESWKITLDIRISKQEAQDVLRKFIDFEPVTPPATFEETYHNQVYFEALDEDDKSIDIKFKNIELSILNGHKSNEGGHINFRMVPVSGIGKTQNIKTQNAGT